MTSYLTRLVRPARIAIIGIVAGAAALLVVPTAQADHQSCSVRPTYTNNHYGHDRGHGHGGYRFNQAEYERGRCAGRSAGWRLGYDDAMCWKPKRCPSGHGLQCQSPSYRKGYREGFRCGYGSGFAEGVRKRGCRSRWGGGWNIGIRW